MPNEPTVEHTPATGAIWRAVKVQRLTPDENRGRHHVFIWCLVGGQVVRDGSVQIRWGWEGQRSDEPSPNKVCDKRDPDPATDIPIERDMRVWCEVAGLDLPSDRVINLHAQFPDEGTGNTWHHNSWAVTFAVANNALKQQPTTPPDPTPLPTGDALTQLSARVTQLEADVKSLLDQARG